MVGKPNNMALILALFLILFTIFISVYHVSKSKFNYWKKKKVPFLKPVPILGNYSEYILLKKSIGEVVTELCQKFPNEPYFGVYYGTEPTLIVQDPKLIKLVLTKDFYYFSGREITKYTHHEITTKNIFFNGGDNWKVVRQNVTPLFTSSKIKNMFHIIEDCSHIFEDMLEKESSTADVLEVKSLMVKFAMRCIVSCAFGVDTHTMDSNENNIFINIGNLIYDDSNYRGFKYVARSIWPAIFYAAGLKVFSEKIDNFFSKMLKGVFQSRNYKPSPRKDFVDLVLSLKEQKYFVGESLSNFKDGGDKKIYLEVDDDLLIAQCITLFAGGFETSATTLRYTLYELSKNQDAQQKACAEIDAYLKRHDNKLSYDCVNELPYLEACVYETLRLYPIIGVFPREVLHDYQFPDGLRLEKGLRVHIPVSYLHKHPDYFIEPEIYRPERHLSENKHEIQPYTYFPFGEGPKGCIGKRFAKMQLLSGLVTFLKQYHFELAPDMPASVGINPRALITQPCGGIRLQCLPREGWKGRKYSRKTK